MDLSINLLAQSTLWESQSTLWESQQYSKTSLKQLNKAKHAPQVVPNVFTIKKYTT